MPSLSSADTFAEARSDTYDLQSSQYRKSVVVSRYSRDEGLLTIPVMGPAGTAPVVSRVHAPIGYRHVDFDLARDGAPPVFPAQADTTSGDVILSSDLAFPAPMGVGAMLVFACRGRYEFVQPGEPRGTESLYPFDRHPFPSMVDALGLVDRARAPFGTQGANTTYNTGDGVDARYLSSYGMLG